MSGARGRTSCVERKRRELGNDEAINGELLRNKSPLNFLSKLEGKEKRVRQARKST